MFSFNDRNVRTRWQASKIQARIYGHHPEMIRILKMRLYQITTATIYEISI